jgi:hypothetical protein
MIRTKALDCPVFQGNNPLTGEIIWASRVRGGSECIKEFIRIKNNWDGSSNVMAIAAEMEEDEIKGWQQHALGKRKGYKLDSAVLFPNQGKGTIKRILDFDLTSFVFFDMVSDWLGPTLLSTSGSSGSLMRRTTTSTTGLKPRTWSSTMPNHSGSEHLHNWYLDPRCR